MPYIGRGLQTGEYKLITLSESFDGSRVDFTMSESVPTERVLLVILSGVMQHWGDAFTVNGTTLTFSEAPSVDDEVKILKLGDTLNIATPSLETVGTAQLSKTGIQAGYVFKVNDAGTDWELGQASTPEVYGFNKDSDGKLIVTTTNQGSDNITNSQYEAFDEFIYASSGFSFTVNSSGNLIVTI